MTIAADVRTMEGARGRPERPERSRRPLAALLGADLVSQAGNMLTWVAIPWFVLETTGSAALTGVTAATEAVAVVIAGVLGGAVVDRLGQKRTSIIGDLASAATVAMIPTLHHTVGLAYWNILVLVFLGALLDIPGWTARRNLYATVAELGAVSLERANTAGMIVNRAAGLIGPLLAGVLIAGLGPTPVLWIDGATFLVSAGLIAGGIPARIVSRNPVASPAGRGFRTQASRYLGEVREGFGFIRQDGAISALIAVSALGSLLAEPLWSVVFPVYADRVFGSAVDLGIIFGALAAGSLIGNALFFVWGERLPRRPTILVGFTVRVLTLWVLVAMPSLEVIVVTVAINAIFLEPTNPITMTIMHERVPEELRGRVLGAGLSLSYVARSAGLLAYGVLLQVAGLREALIAMAALNGIVPLLIWLAPALNTLDATRTRRTLVERVGAV
jgi:MFS family permease